MQWGQLGGGGAGPSRRGLRCPGENEGMGGQRRSVGVSPVPVGDQGAGRAYTGAGNLKGCGERLLLKGQDESTRVPALTWCLCVGPIFLL